MNFLLFNQCGHETRFLDGSRTSYRELLSILLSLKALIHDMEYSRRTEFMNEVAR